MQWGTESRQAQEEKERVREVEDRWRNPRERESKRGNFIAS